MLGVATDQFLRYAYDVSDVVRATDNVLEVVFRHNISVDGRYMACSGGWDWAPYSVTTDADGLRDFTRGIWKSVYGVTDTHRDLWVGVTCVGGGGIGKSMHGVLDTSRDLWVGVTRGRACSL